MSDPLSKLEIEDVLSSIRRLVSEELRPAVAAAEADAVAKAIAAETDDAPETSVLKLGDDLVPPPLGASARVFRDRAGLEVAKIEATPQPEDARAEVAAAVDAAEVGKLLLTPSLRIVRDDEPNVGALFLSDLAPSQEEGAPAAEDEAVSQISEAPTEALAGDLPSDNLASDDAPPPTDLPAAHWSVEPVSEVGWMQSAEDWADEEPLSFIPHPRPYALGAARAVPAEVPPVANHAEELASEPTYSSLDVPAELEAQPEALVSGGEGLVNEPMAEPAPQEADLGELAFAPSPEDVALMAGAPHEAEVEIEVEEAVEAEAKREPLQLLEPVRVPDAAEARDEVDEAEAPQESDDGALAFKAEAAAEVSAPAQQADVAEAAPFIVPVVEPDPIAASAQPQAMVSSDELRGLVRQVLRDELAGDLGERITRNVRKLVRMELNRALAMRDLGGGGEGL